MTMTMGMTPTAAAVAPTQRPDNAATGGHAQEQNGSNIETSPNKCHSILLGEQYAT